MKIKSNDNLNLDDLLQSISKKDNNDSESREIENQTKSAEEEREKQALIEKKRRFQEEKLRAQKAQVQAQLQKQNSRQVQRPQQSSDIAKNNVNPSNVKQQPPLKIVEQNIPKNNIEDKDIKNSYRNSGMLVTASFKFAKDQYTRTFALLIMMSIITCIVLFQTYSVATYKAPVKYIPIYEDKTIIDPIPLNKPVMSDDQMKQWLADSVSDIFSYNYLDLDKHGEKISGLFTETGYATFKKAFDSSADVARVKGQSLIVVSNVVGSPVKAFPGYKVSGPYAYWDWKFQLRQAFVSPNNRFIPVTYDVVVTIIRQDQRNYRSGIAIHSLRIEGSSELQSNSSK